MAAPGTITLPPAVARTLRDMAWWRQDAELMNALDARVVHQRSHGPRATVVLTSADQAARLGALASEAMSPAQSRAAITRARRALEA